MNADAHYLIGDGHAVCQDYALANGSVAVVADGCSSSPGSDVGARLLARLALRSLCSEKILRRASTMARALALPPTALDATLLAITADGRGADVVAYGDGVVAARARNGGLEIHHLRYPSGAPAYLSYGLDPCRLRRYRELGLQRSVQVGDNTPLTTTADPLAPLRLHFSADRYDLVVVASDGAAAIRDAQRDPVDVDAVLAALTDFPRVQGRLRPAPLPTLPRPARLVARRRPRGRSRLPVKIFLKGKSLTLRRKEFVAAGGEGSVYGPPRHRLQGVRLPRQGSGAEQARRARDDQ